MVVRSWGVGVADGGNQTMVEVGGGVSVAGMGVLVTSQSSMLEQAVKRSIRSKRDADERRCTRRKWFMHNIEIASGEEHTCPGGWCQGKRPRNDIRIWFL